MNNCTPIRFVFGNAIRRGVLSISTPILVGQPDYLLNEHRSRYCKFPIDAPTVIECHLLNERGIDAVVLAQHNLTELASVRIEVLDNAGSVLAEQRFEPPPATGQLAVGTVWRAGIDPFDPPPPGARPFPATFAAWLDDVTRATRLRISIYDPGNPEGFTRLGVVMAGRSVRLSRNFAYGASLTPITSGATTRLASGFAVRSQLRKKARSWSLSLEAMTEDDRAALYAADERYPNEPVFVSGYSAGTDWQREQYNFLAILDQSPCYSHDYYQGHSTSLTLLEV